MNAGGPCLLDQQRGACDTLWWITIINCEQRRLGDEFVRLEKSHSQGVAVADPEHVIQIGLGDAGQTLSRSYGQRTCPREAGSEAVAPVRSAFRANAARIHRHLEKILDPER